MQRRDWPADYLPSVEKFLAEDYLRPSGGDCSLDAINSQWLFPLQRRYELEAMIRIAKRYKPSVVMEIGADKGAGVYQWCKCVTTIKRFIGVEICGTPYAALMEKAFPHIEFLWINESSYDSKIVNQVKEWLKGDPIDTLFIDGDKSAFHQDFDCYLPLMGKDSVVFMHDINDRPPRTSYDLVCARGYEHGEIIDIRDTHEAIQRQKQGYPPSSPHEGWLRYWEGKSAGVGVIYLGKKPKSDG